MDDKEKKENESTEKDSQGKETVQIESLGFGVEYLD